MTQDHLVSCVIPCYHSEHTLPQVVRDIQAVFATRPDYDYEIILVNDNPPDATWQVIETMVRENPRIHGICFSRNFGQHAALMAGYRHVRGGIVVSLDDDGQNPPSEMFRLIDAMDETHDLVYANYTEKHHSHIRNLGSRLTNRMFSWMLGKPKDLYLASYYAARRFVIDEMVRCESPFPFVDGLALRSTTHYLNVPMDHLDRAEGKSGYTLSGLFRLWTNAFTSFSVKPLRIATFTGCVSSVSGVLLGLILILRKLILRDDVDAGWTSLMAMMLILSGILMMMLGLIGEYVGRIFVTMNRSPQYVIKYDSAREEMLPSSFKTSRKDPET